MRGAGWGLCCTRPDGENNTADDSKGRGGVGDGHDDANDDVEDDADGATACGGSDGERGGAVEVEGVAVGPVLDGATDGGPPPDCAGAATAPDGCGASLHGDSKGAGRGRRASSTFPTSVRERWWGGWCCWWGSDGVGPDTVRRTRLCGLGSVADENGWC